MSNAENYSHRAISGSFWNTLSYLIQAAIGFTLSIILARYLGASDYGIYSYLIWVITIIAIILDLGFSQALRKYIPRYFQQDESRSLALKIGWTLCWVQVAISLIGLLLLIISINYWQPFTALTLPSEKGLLIFAVIIALPTLFFRTLSTFVGAAHLFKQLSITTIITQIVLFFSLVLAARMRLNISFLLAGFLLSNLVGVLLIVVPLLKAGKKKAQQDPKKYISRNDILHYTSIAYLNLLLQFVVWNQSEIFFLGRYSKTEEIGFYALSFSLAAFITGAVGMINQVIANLQFEILEKKEDKRNEEMANLTIKYLALLFIPLATIAAYLLFDLVHIIYGAQYLTVATIFPLLVFGSLIANLSNPLSVGIANNNRHFSITVGIGFIGAVINIVLDLAFIPHHGAHGAALANFLTQLITTASITSYVLYITRQHLNIKPLLRIVLLASILFLPLFLFGMQWSLLSKVIIILGVTIIFFTLSYFPSLQILTDADRILLNRLRRRIL